MRITDLAHVNVSLNALSAILLTCGFVAVKRRHIGLHKAFMLSAMAAGALFLTSYVIYHWYAGSKPFEGQGALRVIYFMVLISHVVLAAACLPLVIVTATRALRGRIDKHRTIARITLPVWWYVSLTGIVVYFMLYGAPVSLH